MRGPRTPGQYGEGMVYVDNRELERSLKVLTKKLERVMGKYMSNEVVKEIFVNNAEGFRDAIAQHAPMHKGVYKVGKLGRNTKKGFKQRGTKIRLPGTLKRSMTVFPARDEMDTTVYIGPRRKGAKYGDKSADGFYGYFQNYGTQRGVTGKRFIQAAYAQENNRIARRIIEDLARKVEKANRELNGASS